MSMAYVMINAETGGEVEIMDVLRSIFGVQEVYQVYGVYDIIIKIEAETMNEKKGAHITKNKAPQKNQVCFNHDIHLTALESNYKIRKF